MRIEMPLSYIKCVICRRNPFPLKIDPRGNYGHYGNKSQVCKYCRRKVRTKIEKGNVERIESPKMLARDSAVGRGSWEILPIVRPIPLSLPCFRCQGEKIEHACINPLCEEKNICKNCPYCWDKLDKPLKEHILDCEIAVKFIPKNERRNFWKENKIQ